MSPSVSVKRVHHESGTAARLLNCVHLLWLYGSESLLQIHESQPNQFEMQLGTSVTCLRTIHNFKQTVD